MVVHHWSDDGMVMYHRRSLFLTILSKATAEADQFVEKASKGQPRPKQDEVRRKEKAAGLDGSAGVVKELDGSAAGVVKGLVSNAICKHCFFTKSAFNPPMD